MDYYYLAVTLLTILISIVLIMMTKSNYSFNKRKRKEFCLGFLIIIIGAGLEFLLYICDISINFIEFPKYLLMLITLGIFLKNIVYLSKEVQGNNQIQLIAGFLFLFVCIVMQLAIPVIKIEWLAIVIWENLVYCCWNSTMQFIDRLTGLLNQRCYYSFWENTQDTNFILIICDLNYFKSINDQYGHAFGDMILVQVSQAMKENYSKIGKCYRIGGDEFAIIIPDLNVNVDELRKTFNQKLMEKRKKIPQMPTVAMGYAIYNGDNYSTQKEADDKMYKDKKSISKGL